MRTRGILSPRPRRHKPRDDCGLRLGVSGNTGTVQRFNGTSGTFVDTIVSAASGNLSLPIGALFGTDSQLYVASFNNNKVARYDPGAGAALGDFVAAGSGGITGPNFMLFRPPATPFAISRKRFSEAVSGLM